MISRPANSPAVLGEIKALEPLQKELLLILKEIRVITDKVEFLIFFSARVVIRQVKISLIQVKEEDEAAAVEADWKESISRHFFSIKKKLVF